MDYCCYLSDSLVAWTSHFLYFRWSHSCTAGDCSNYHPGQVDFWKKNNRRIMREVRSSQVI